MSVKGISTKLSKTLLPLPAQCVEQLITNYFSGQKGERFAICRTEQLIWKELWLQALELRTQRKALLMLAKCHTIAVGNHMLTLNRNLQASKFHLQTQSSLSALHCPSLKCELKRKYPQAWERLQHWIRRPR